MNKTEDILNCYKKIPIYKFLDSNVDIQSLLNEKLLFYTKIIENEWEFDTQSSNKFIYIRIFHEIEIEENFKKIRFLIHGIKVLPADKVKSIIDDSICIEYWVLLQYPFKIKSPQ